MKPHSEQRKERLAAALRANLRRRKALAYAPQSRHARDSKDHSARQQEMPTDLPPAGE